MTQKIRITSKSGQTIIEIDGQKISGVKMFYLYQEVGCELPTLFLELHAIDVEIEGNADTVSVEAAKRKDEDRTD